MNDAHIHAIAKELSLPAPSVSAAVSLLDEGATVPFIARYRKEATGSLDEVAVASVRDLLNQLIELDKRRESILASLRERDLLNDALEKAIVAAQTKADLEDIYLPYKPKRRTRAALAKERGLEPLAVRLFAQTGQDPQKLAHEFVNPDNDVPDETSALAQARDIIAEQVSESPILRSAIRELFTTKARFRSKVAKKKQDASEATPYRDWFDWDEAARTIAGHRALAMFRGEREGILSLSIRPDQEEAIRRLRSRVLKGRGKDSEQVGLAIDDGYKRLLAPSLENELRTAIKIRADEEAIRVFTNNLRELLLSSPLGQKRVLALDPGYRTGAKTVVLDAQGGLVSHTTIYPTGSQKQQDEAAATVRRLVNDHAVEAIAVGNGTAGRETETFVRALNLDLPVVLVNESGASIYSASEIARREFPDLDLTVRGAVSIGRRLMDPLAELVKIDPKSIGVGQYQHDVDQAALKRALDDVVTSCVGAVGVDVNTASPELLGYVPGLGPSLAQNIIEHRNAGGPFQDRKQLLAVKRLGPKAFEQAAGFLRVRGKNPLDASAVHPERYTLVERMAQSLGMTSAELMTDGSARERIALDAFIDDSVGLPTLTDIMAELAKPGRDPRPAFEIFSFADVHDITDLHQGMHIPGIVTNVTKFGAFVDVGVHRDGLVHISQLADHFVSDPASMVNVGQHVMVTVTDVDTTRQRIGLSMKTAPLSTE
ncbi:Tex family protein [Desulfovibrio inopinatus]|uniref:Tex family protein n=1 Tax=Desulfovibrio inopinatus TaxID=102109 RepID=UPI00047FEF3C|nr:Tex family protein [Desulfovibrio inopinatus]